MKSRAGSGTSIFFGYNQLQARGRGLRVSHLVVIVDGTGAEPSLQRGNWGGTISGCTKFLSEYSEVRP